MQQPVREENKQISLGAESDAGQTATTALSTGLLLAVSPRGTGGGRGRGRGRKRRGGEGAERSIDIPSPPPPVAPYRVLQRNETFGL